MKSKVRQTNYFLPESVRGGCPRHHLRRFSRLPIQTIANNLFRIYGKLAISSRVELVLCNESGKAEESSQSKADCRLNIHVLATQTTLPSLTAVGCSRLDPLRDNSYRSLV